MSEYISREATKKAIEDFRLDQTRSKYLTKEDCKNARNAIDRVQSVIDGIPTADVQEVRHGEWIEYPRAHYFKCSVCKYTVPYRKAVLINGKREYNYCPNCGARMDGGSK